MMTSDASAVAQAPSRRKIWKLLSAAAAHAVLFIGGPYFLQHFELIEPLAPKAYVVLIVTWVGLALKLLLGDVASDEFAYHKHGYDFCVLTMGTSLSMLSLQMLSAHDLFPGLPNTGPLAALADLSPNLISQRIILLTLLFLVSCVLALLTARISRAISREGSSGNLAAFNCALGAFTFFAYLFLLLAKGA